MLRKARDYRVVPLAPHHADDAAILGRILQDEPETAADPKRKDFYWVEADRSRFYVNVHDRTQTVYLVTVDPAIAPKDRMECKVAS